MPYFPDANSFLEHSRLLVSARPTTTRITTKYTVPDPGRESRTSKASNSSPTPQQAHPPGTTLTLKTYDPVSGTCLKYKTDKAAEVGRLIATLANCGRVMAALPEKQETAMQIDEPVKEEAEEFKVVSKESPKAGQAEGQASGKGGPKRGGGGSGGKKKKGKK